MPRALLITGLLALLGCGAPASRTQPVAVATSGADVAPERPPRPTEAEWVRACDPASAATLVRFRDLALAEARADEHADRIRSLEAWQPVDRGRAAPVVDEGARAVAIGVVRRALHLCGERAAIALTGELVRFQTVAAIAPAGQNAEHLAMARFLGAWAEARGLRFAVSGDHDAWEIELPGRSRERALAYVFHGDVVPVNDPPSVIAADAIPDGWTVPPFGVTERDGRLYGRGTEDDKGPIAAAMIVLEALASSGLEPDGSIVLAIGTAEEESWDGMRRYAASAPPARHVISVDSNYPVVVAESGFVAWGFRRPLVIAPPASSGSRSIGTIVSARSGLFLTQIPDRAELVIRPGAVLREPRGRRVSAPEWVLAQARWAIEGELAERADGGYRADAEVIDHEGAPAVRIVAHGRSAHASVPEEGRNALTFLAAIAERLIEPWRFPPHDVPRQGVPRAPGLDRQGIAETLLDVARWFDGDLHGERMGLAHDDELMGPLVVAPTLLRTDAGEVRVEVNMRRPRGLTSDAFRARLDRALARLDGARALDEIHVGEPHVADLDGELVPTLMAIWRAHTGERGAQPRSIRGGTYARLFPGAVDFGPSLQGRPYTGHGADEYLELEALRMMLSTTYDASLRLTGIGR